MRLHALFATPRGCIARPFGLAGVEDLETLRRVAQVASADPQVALREVVANAAQRFVDSLPPDLLTLLNIGMSAPGAIAGLKSGDSSGWVALIRKAQDEWVSYIDKQWSLPQRCKDKLMRQAAESSPVAALSNVPLENGCGAGKDEDHKPGRVYWRPLGIGKPVEEWAFDLPPRFGTSTQSWVPDNRQSRSDGYVFCPAMFPYCVPGSLPRTGDVGTSAIMADRYTDLVKLGTPQGDIDWITNRLLSIVAIARIEPAGNDPVPFVELPRITLVQEIPQTPDPAKVYLTPDGQIWSLTDSQMIYSDLNAPDTFTMKATIGGVKAMLASLASLSLRNALVTQGADANAAFEGAPQRKGRETSTSDREGREGREGRAASTEGNASLLQRYGATAALAALALGAYLVATIRSKYEKANAE